MPSASILKFPTSSPEDTTPLTRLHESGYKPEQILGVIGKTEGNGCVNDFSRTLSSCAWNPLIPESAISIFSGGTEGVLSPHVAFVLESRTHTGLRAAVGRSKALEPWEVGTESQVFAVSSQIHSMLACENIRVEDVQLVLIKCPLLTSTKITGIRASGRQPLTFDTYESMALSRYASAVGIGNALGALSAELVTPALETRNFHTPKASCSSGAELDDCHILILANDPLPSGQDSTLRAFAGVMDTAIDFTGLRSTLTQALSPLPPYRKATLIQVFAKAEADPSGLVAGRFRHTMLTDSDVHSTRHARAAVGGLVAGVTGDCYVYVSGGAEGQGPAGGGGLCVIAKWEV